MRKIFLKLSYVLSICFVFLAMLWSKNEAAAKVNPVTIRQWYLSFVGVAQRKWAGHQQT